MGFPIAPSTSIQSTESRGLPQIGEHYNDDDCDDDDRGSDYNGNVGSDDKDDDDNGALSDRNG